MSECGRVSVSMRQQYGANAEYHIKKQDFYDFSTTPLLQTPSLICCAINLNQWCVKDMAWMFSPCLVLTS